MCINYIFLTVTIVLCQFLAVVWGDLPSEIKKCKSTDNDGCIGKTIEDILKRYPTGNPVFGMPNVSALNLTHVAVSRSNPNSPIQINFEFTKCTVNGIENVKVLRTSGFDKEMKKVEIDVVTPGLRLIGDYIMTGKLLLLPLNGKGKGEVDIKGVNATFRVKMEKREHDNKHYFKVKKIKGIVHPEQMLVNFENVFHGNPVLSKTINEVINENWKDVWTELQEGINHALEYIIETTSNKIFEVLPVEDMYSD